MAKQSKSTHSKSAADDGEQELKIHPLVRHMPRMSESDFASHRASIDATGQQHPIILLDGMILDGAHRYRACRELDITPKFEQHDSAKHGSPVEFVIAMAAHRNPTPTQRAIIAEGLMDELSRGRMGRPRKDAPETPKGTSAELAAARFGISHSTVETVRQIRRASKELYEQMSLGKLKVSQAKNRFRHEQRKSVVEKLKSAPKGSVPDFKIIVGKNVPVMQKMQAGSVRCVFADPQYNCGWKYDNDPTGDKLPLAKYLAEFREWVGMAARLLTDDGSLFVVIDDAMQDYLSIELRKAGLHRQRSIIWWERFGQYNADGLTRAARFIHYFSKSAKPLFNTVELREESQRQKGGDKRANTNGRVPDNVWDFSRKTGNAGDAVPFDDAPPQLPVEIPERCILLATHPGDLVIDPFNGNGTTGIAALRNQRRYVGIENSAKYARQSELWIRENIARSATSEGSKAA